MITPRLNLSVDRDDNMNIRAASIFGEIVSEELLVRIAVTMGITPEQARQLEDGTVLPITLFEPRLIQALGIGVDEDDSARFVAIESMIEDRKDEISLLSGRIKSAQTIAVQAAEVAASKTAGRSLEVLKAAVRKLVRIDELSPEDVEDLVDLYEPWAEAANVTVGEIRSYERRLYKVIQAHTTQADWTPDVTPALWQEIAPPTTEDGTEIVPEWKQPTGAHDAYNTGDRVLYAPTGKVYRSKIDANTTVPNGDEPYNRYWEVEE